MRDMSLPEQNEDILKCMLSSTVLPIPNIEKEIALDLKPNFPFGAVHVLLSRFYLDFN